MPPRFCGSNLLFPLVLEKPILILSSRGTVNANTTLHIFPFISVYITHTCVCVICDYINISTYTHIYTTMYAHLKFSLKVKFQPLFIIFNVRQMI